MYFKWTRFWNGAGNADLGRNRIDLTKRRNTTFMSAFYDRIVRTKSYNDIVGKVELLSAQSRAESVTPGLPSFIPTDRLLEPTQEIINVVLKDYTDSETPQMLKMVTDFFENSRMASTLCSIVLYCIEQARGQWGSMDLTLAEFPQSGETLGFAKQQSITKCFSEMVSMENPFTDEQACDIFTNVRSRYTLLSEEVEGSRDMISRQAKERRRWRQWLIGMTALMVAGATLVVVVVTMHVVAGMAAAPIMLGMAAVARDKFQESGERSFKMQMRKAKVERVMSKCKLQQNKAGMTVNDDMDMTGLNMDMSGVLVGGMEVDTMLQDGTTVIEGKAADRGRFSAVIGDPLGECCRLAPIWDHRRTRGWWCWGSTTLAGQSAKLDALACGIFLVNNMLDTLSCLVRGLQEDWEYNRKLIEFGCVHCKEAACLQQVGRQLLRSHTNLYKQLTNLEEQVLVFLLFINKARHTVLQKFPNKNLDGWIQNMVLYLVNLLPIIEWLDLCNGTGHIFNSEVDDDGS